MVIGSLKKLHAFAGLLLCAVLVSASPISYAREQVTLSPPSKSTNRTHLVTVGACRFNMNDSLGGKVRQYPKQDLPSATYDAELKRSTLPNAVIIDFLCDAKGQEKFCRRFAGVERRGDHWVQWLHPDPDYREPPEARVIVREVKSVNGDGATSTRDDTIGDEKDRVRRLSVCLISPSGNALIGKAVVDSLYGNHRSTEPEVRKLLQSIEFIENP